ncbi:hypothetical protein [Paracraurococcus lichenis]|uniref:Lipoprotein n=1 Tax=Paracraurococcus lichenis TaxID=3064888 RepID=A0ABT9DVM4_9PROT|nr:hypothetical protein [Paracraurococcus sp. LOR1-02]MDO9707850.1 hypothetical protein [Paracraurococcus sp. LOR1-02]
MRLRPLLILPLLAVLGGCAVYPAPYAAPRPYVYAPPPPPPHYGWGYRPYGYYGYGPGWRRW